ncbi:MAG: hypothetical protein IIC76_09565 [Bacteroidetes bacterium]|nr:hypothetical protein [Bacteroidota bacterium]
MNILILPLTLATLGLFKFLAHAITIYVVDLALPQFEVVGFDFAGYSTQYFEIPAINFGPGIMSYIAFSVVLSLVVTAIHWVAK